MSTTVPDAAAAIGVPPGTAISTPACSRPQRMPKPDAIGPLTGQISPLEPLRTGAEAVVGACEATRAEAADAAAAAARRARVPARCGPGGCRLPPGSSPPAPTAERAPP